MLNLPVSPAWMWQRDPRGPALLPAPPNQIPVPFDAYGNRGTQLNVSLEQFGAYHGRVADWFLAGGFVDEQRVAQCRQTLAPPCVAQLYEVLNEPGPDEHNTSIVEYTKMYDEIVPSVQREVEGGTRVYESN